MKRFTITLALALSTIFASATEGDKDRTFFGNEYNASELVTLSTAMYEVNVVKGSPLHQLYISDVTAFEMSINNTIETSTNPNINFKTL